MTTERTPDLAPAPHAALLTGRNVLVFAATGAVASAVARSCAEHGATVWLSARDAASLEALADEIRAAGGTAHVDEVDALDGDQIDGYAARVASADGGGGVDAVFNGIGGRPADLGYPATLAELSADAFSRPLTTIVTSQYLTSRAAGLAMAERGRGSVITLSATLSGMAAPHMAGISAACGAVEAMTRSLAGELGPRGVRVNCVRASAMPETRTIEETSAGQAAIVGDPPSYPMPPLGRPVSTTDTARTAVFLASDLSSATTGQTLTVCAGAFV
ncbi:MAG: SDR family NAD(P)-dependent oxidoreductase [Phycicoccus sp.]